MCMDHLFKNKSKTFFTLRLSPNEHDCEWRAQLCFDVDLVRSHSLTPIEWQWPCLPVTGFIPTLLRRSWSIYAEDHPSPDMELSVCSKISSVCSSKPGLGRGRQQFLEEAGHIMQIKHDICIKTYTSIIFCKAQRTPAHSKCPPNFIQWFLPPRKLKSLRSLKVELFCFLFFVFFE